MFLLLKTHVSGLQSKSERPGQTLQVHTANGRDTGRRLSLQVSQLALDDRWQSRPRNAQTHVYPSGFAGHWRTMDVKSYFVSQAQTHQ